MPTINYAIDSTFRPYSFQERLAPYLLYKDAYEKTEAAYDELSQKANTFKYLASATADDPEARAIYEGYARDLQTQADDLQKNGLTAANRRALTSLKRRYSGEIGQLDLANTAMQEERKRRMAIEGKDNSQLYATPNLKISDFLPGRNANLYSVSGEELRKEGAIYGQNVTSKMYSNPVVNDISKYYQEILQTQGYSPEIMNAWREDLESVPEFNQAVEDILKARGVTENLSGADYDRAKQSVINGIMEGSVYKESREMKQNPGVLTRDQALDNARQQRALQLNEETHGLRWNPNTQSYERNDPNEWMYTHEDESNPNTSRRTGINKDAMPTGYTMNPNTGKLVKESAPKPTQEEKEENSFNKKRSAELLKLNKDPNVFKNNEGFDITVDNQNLHYSYIGAISKHGDKWEHGALGTDVPGRGWGFTSSSNVMSPWGNFSATDIDNDELENVKVLADNEVSALMASDTQFTKTVLDEISRYLEEQGLDEDTPVDYQVVQVPNENGVKKNGYLIAVRTL